MLTEGELKPSDNTTGRTKETKSCEENGASNLSVLAIFPEFPLRPTLLNRIDLRPYASKHPCKP
jgi:hypothetical protein